MTKNKILYLESLRGIAAISVAFFHAKIFAGDSPLVNNPFVLNGYLMVDFFFVLSGFVIAYNYVNRITNVTSLLAFQKKRFLRLYPLHFLTLMIFAAFELAHYFKEEITGVIGTVPAFEANNVSAFISNLLLVQGFTQKQFTFNYPSWSISTEFYTYAIFGMASLFVSSSRGRIIVNACAVILSGAVLYSFEDEAVLNLFRCTYSFFLGVLVCRLYQSTNLRIPGWMAYCCVISVIVAVCFGREISNLLHPLIFALLILSLLLSDTNSLKNFLSSPKLVFLGTISYGIYMLHATVWAIIFQLLKLFSRYQKLPGANTDSIAMLVDEFTGTALLVVGTSFVLFFAYLSYRYVEMPLQKAQMD